MRKILLPVIVLAIVLPSLFSTYGCTETKAPKKDSVPMTAVDSDSVAEDSSESIISSTPMPKAADELFDDFVFNFAANKKLQYKRIVFPLKLYSNGVLKKEIGSSSWKMEHFFMRQDYYTVILDNSRQSRLVKDTTIKDVIIEKIYLDRKTVRQYIFKRLDGKWMMTAINNKPMSKNKNASFLKFYKKFANDSAYQNSHIYSPLKFSGPDPDDDFSTMHGDLMPEQWPAFSSQVVLPKHMIYNILYGQKYTESSTKLFLIRGISNGLEQDLTFRRINGVWYLTKLNI